MSNVLTAGRSMGFWNMARHWQVAPLLTAVALGLVCALLIAAKPLIGVGFVLGVIAFVLVSNRAELAFAILILSFAIPVQKSLAGLPLNMTDATIVLWGAAWPFLMLKKSFEQSDTPPEPFEIPKLVWILLPLVLAAFISLLDAENFSGSLKQAIRLVEWFIVLPVLFMSLKLNRHFWLVAAALFMLIPPFFALDGVVEVFNHGKSISKMLHIPVPVPDKEHSEIRHTYDVSKRAGSTFGGAQGLAMYLTMMMAMILAITLKPPHPVFRIIGLGALAVCVAGMVVAKSRGGLLGCVVMTGVMFLVMYPRPTFRLMVMGGVAVGLALVGFLLFYGWDGTIAGIIPGRVDAVLDRLIIWQRALSVFAAHPINGVGFGGFHDNVYNNGGIQLNVGLGYESLHCHNTYLEALTGTGLIGITSYLAFLFLSWKNLLRMWRNRTGAYTDCFILGAIGGLGAYMMFGMVDMLFLQNMHMTLVTLLMLGFMAGKQPKQIQEEPKVNP